MFRITITTDNDQCKHDVLNALDAAEQDGEISAPFNTEVEYFSERVEKDNADALIFVNLMVEVNTAIEKSAQGDLKGANEATQYAIYRLGEVRGKIPANARHEWTSRMKKMLGITLDHLRSGDIHKARKHVDIMRIAVRNNPPPLNLSGV